MRIIFSLIFLATLSFCCKTKQNASSAIPPATPAASPTGDEMQAQKDALNNIVISFYSVGSGVNSKAVDAIEKFIDEYSSKTQLTIPYSKIAWGREGEVDFCISLSELKGGQKKTFVDETRRLARQFELIHFFENYPCRELK